MARTLPIKKVTFLYWGDVKLCLEEKYGEEIAEEVADGWWEWSYDNGNFFYPEIETEYGDNNWVYLLAVCLADKGVNLDEEVFIYAE